MIASTLFALARRTIGLVRAIASASTVAVARWTQKEDGDAPRVIDASFTIASDEPPAAHEPGEEPLDEPTSAVATELAPVLRLRLSRRVVRRDQLDTVLGQLGVESIAVEGHVAD